MKDLQIEIDKMVFSANNLNALSFTLTPQKDDVIRDVFNRIFHPFSYKKRSTKILVVEINEKLNGFISKNREEIASTTCWLVPDFPEKSLIQEVVGLNLLTKK